MMLKMFDCKNKYAKVFRILVCCTAIVCVSAFSIVSLIDAIRLGTIERLFYSLGLMAF